MKKLLIMIIKWYQKYISSRTAPTCKYTPTCSEYAITAINRFGAIRGGYLAAKRVLRCNPLAKGGFDPVPKEEK